MFDLFRSDQTLQRQALLKALSQYSQQRMLKELITHDPESGDPATFEAALGKGKFDEPNLSRLLALLTRPRGFPGGGGGSDSPVSMDGMVAMR